MNLNKIRHNTRKIVSLAEEKGIDIAAVTKATCGDPKVARAMIKGGAKYIADSRLENIKRLKESGVDSDFMLLRTPMLSEVEDVVKYADFSLNSELKVISKLSRISEEIGETHRIVLMVEMGDLREGANRDELTSIVSEIIEYKGVELYGIGMNLACFGGIVPTKKKIKEFNKLVKKVEEKFDISISMVSGGNSANIPLLLKKDLEWGKINNLRIGEGILLGRETVNRSPIEDTFQDAFILESEIIELKMKSSVPDGVVSQNAFGEKPEFEDKGIINHGLTAVGKQDAIVEDLQPLDSNIEVLGSSSDHIILNIESSEYEVGDIVRFNMRYGALVHLFTSSYVNKRYVKE